MPSASHLSSVRGFLRSSAASSSLVKNSLSIGFEERSVASLICPIAFATARRPVTLEHETEDSRTPSCRVPLQFNPHEGVAGKQRRRLHGGLARRRDAPNAESRQIDFKTAQAQAVQRQPLAIRFQLRAGPVTHGWVRSCEYDRKAAATGARHSR